MNPPRRRPDALPLRVRASGPRLAPALAPALAAALAPALAPALAAALAATLVTGCRATLELSPDDSAEVLARHTIGGDDPSEPGPFDVRRLYYGSGTDKNRAEYRDSVAIVTDPVDASKLVSLGASADERNDYWGFSPDSFPINGRVWYPEGEGPFPVVLIVHGNHNMRDYSDPGYGYLGELLASRGYIMTSVDMNFINGGIRGENDGRGWLLLEHLRAWKGFNEDPESPFYGKADLDRVALIGHSRGGEAVGHAAAFNRLRYYPDDASLEFDFGFGVRSVIAIAPVDGQYLPTDRHVPVEDVNYLVFHGSHDGDVTSFHGLRQWARVTYTEPSDLFKAAVYVYRANHGQWNSVWGPHDNGPRSPRILDLEQLIPEEDQRRFGEVYISAFLDATLKGAKQYLPMFRDHRVAADWLPRTMYFNQFQAATFRPIADFEGDIDLTTGSAKGITLEGDSLATWRESDLKLRSRNRANTSASQLNQAVWLGWNRRYRGQSEGDELGRPASYTIRLSEQAVRDLAITGSTALEFRLGPSDDEPPPRTREGEQGEWEDRRGEEDRDRGSDRDSRDRGPDVEKPPIDLSVEIEDAGGARASLAVSDYGVLRRPLTMSILRRRDREEDRFPQRWELVLQSFSIPLAHFAATNPALDVKRVRAVRFVFDRAEVGTVALDDVGFAETYPAFFTGAERAGPAGR